MKYLLSSGSTTTDLVEYIKDLIKIHLLIRIDEVPYWDGGSDDLIRKIKEGEVESQIRTTMSSVITKIQSRFTVTSLNLVNVKIEGSIAKVTVNIEGNEEVYGIAIQKNN
jgi:hypothetical protein